MKYLILPIKILLFCFLLMNKSFGQESQYDQLFRILKNDLKFKEVKSNILVLSNYGCPVCNERFYELITSKKSQNCLYVINNNGATFDVSDLIEIDSDLIRYDYQNLLLRANLITEYSSFIKLSPSEKIDTIVEIVPDNIENTIKYIKKQY